MRLLEPRGGLLRVATGLKQTIDVCTKCVIGHGLPKLVARDGLQNYPRIVGELPQHRIQTTPDHVGRMVPR